MEERISINYAYTENKRIKKGLTQKQLAFRLGVSQQTYSRWIKGIDRPTISNTKKLAKILGISFKKLIEENSSPADQSLTKQDIKEAVLEALSESGVVICPLAGKKKLRG